MKILGFSVLKTNIENMFENSKLSKRFKISLKLLIKLIENHKLFKIERFLNQIQISKIRTYNKIVKFY